MDGKRVLMFVKLSDNPVSAVWVAETRIGNYAIIVWYVTGEHQACMPEPNAELDIWCDGFIAAMDACEADYIARCSEFLRVAGPGEVVVKVDDIAWLIDYATSGLSADKVEGAFGRLTAAIDAASKEGGK